MKPGMTISCIAHAVALGFAVIAISAQPMDAPPVETLATQIISEKDFSQMTKGVKNAQQLKIPDLKPLADKVGDEKSVDQLAPKVADKPPITTPTSAKAEPKPDQPKPDPKSAAKADPKPPDPKPDPKPDTQAEPKPDQKADQKQPDRPKAPEYKPDQIAKLLKKDAAKEAKADDSSAQLKQNAPKFNANQVAELLDQREPQRQLATASQINNLATLGAAQAPQAAELSQDELGAFKARLAQCWTLPPGITSDTNIHIFIDAYMQRDGRLAGQPEMVGGSPRGKILEESAKRALLTCQPFTMLKPEHYDAWKFLQLDFNPHDLFGG
ncbi:MAG TPA: hypothetical protein VMA30_17315 [Xanthobacteraceae bacterium]|nr:hypothetical protein [Xanthobacteraceae bacterium]